VQYSCVIRLKIMWEHIVNWEDYVVVSLKGTLTLKNIPFKMNIYVK